MRLDVPAESARRGDAVGHVLAFFVGHAGDVEVDDQLDRGRNELPQECRTLHGASITDTVDVADVGQLGVHCLVVFGIDHQAVDPIGASEADVLELVEDGTIVAAHHEAAHVFAEGEDAVAGQGGGGQQAVDAVGILFDEPGDGVGEDLATLSVGVLILHRPTVVGRPDVAVHAGVAVDAVFRQHQRGHKRPFEPFRMQDEVESLGELTHGRALVLLHLVDVLVLVVGATVVKDQPLGHIDIDFGRRTTARIDLDGDHAARTTRPQTRSIEQTHAGILLRRRLMDLDVLVGGDHGVDEFRRLVDVDDVERTGRKEARQVFEVAAFQTDGQPRRELDSFFDDPRVDEIQSIGSVVGVFAVARLEDVRRHHRTSDGFSDELEGSLVLDHDRQLLGLERVEHRPREFGVAVVPLDTGEIVRIFFSAFAQEDAAIGRFVDGQRRRSASETQSRTKNVILITHGVVKSVGDGDMRGQLSFGSALGGRE